MSPPNNPLKILEALTGIMAETLDRIEGGLDDLNKTSRESADSLKRVAERKKEATKATKDEEEGEKKLTEERKKSTAGLVGLTAVSQNLLSGPLRGLQAAIGAVGAQVSGFVGKLQPAAVQRFTFALSDMEAAIGKALVPVLDTATQVVRAIGAAFNGLTADGQRVVQGVAAGAVALVAFGSALAVVETVLTGGLAPVLGAVTAAVVGVVAGSGAMSDVFGELSGVLSGALESVGRILGAFVPLATPVINVLKDLGSIFAGTAGVIAGFSDRLVPAFAAVSAAVDSLWQAIRPIVEGAIDVGLGVFGEIITAVGKAVETAAPYVAAFGRALGEVVKRIGEHIQTMLGYFGIQLPDVAAAPKGPTKGAEGLSVRSTSTGDVEGLLKRAREASFLVGGPGAEKKPDERAATAAEGIRAKVDEIYQSWSAEIAAVITGVDAVASVLRGIYERVNEWVTKNSESLTATGNVVAKAPGEVVSGAFSGRDPNLSIAKLAIEAVVLSRDLFK